jgi:hypothetical protein
VKWNIQHSRKLLWLKRVISDFGYQIKKRIKIYADNQSSNKLVDKYKFSNHTKHIETKAHFIQDLKQKGLIYIEFVPSEHNLADLLAKPLGKNKIKKLSMLSGVIPTEETENQAQEK